MAEGKELPMPARGADAPVASGGAPGGAAAGSDATHLVEVCSGTCCSGPLSGDSYFRELCRLAGVNPDGDGVSGDRVFRVQRVDCLDVCDSGPILRVDGNAVFKQVSLVRTEQLLDALRRGRDPSSGDLAGL
ncbi:MAG: (2Fe-2S) ferredoxin domain-containing protein [Candidatus Sericytochromatia bacterium]|nr:(2Fe-2S) ferredoxin domain-containing protein [Candidatus Tanganyikabacteria bacterium]